MIKLENVKKSYQKNVALERLNLELKPGTILGLLGSNGAGKTTTFRLILDLLSPDEGTIKIADNINLKNIHQSLGYLPEERALVPTETVYQQIVFFGKLKGLNIYEIEKLLDYYLKVFDIEHYKKSKVKKLSKGNQQKIQFISAVIGKPKLLILDEPFTGLDPQTVNLMKDELLKLKEQGVSIIFSSHQMSHVEGLCDEISVLVKGRQIIYGDTLEIQQNSNIRKVFLRGDIDIEIIKEKVKLKNHKIIRDEHSFEIERSDVTSVFEIVKQFNNIEKFAAEYPTIEDIYISCVEAYDNTL